jgi:hypothetical protein
VSASVVEFAHIVKGCPLRSEHDIIFFLKAGLARSGGGVKVAPCRGLSPLEGTNCPPPSAVAPCELYPKFKSMFYINVHTDLLKLLGRLRI